MDKQSQIAKLQEEIKFLTKLISNKHLGGEARMAYIKKIIKAKHMIESLQEVETEATTAQAEELQVETTAPAQMMVITRISNAYTWEAPIENNGYAKTEQIRRACIHRLQSLKLRVQAYKNRANYYKVIEHGAIIARVEIVDVPAPAQDEPQAAEAAIMATEAPAADTVAQDEPQATTAPKFVTIDETLYYVPAGNLGRKSNLSKSRYMCKVVDGAKSMIGCSVSLTAESPEKAAIKLLTNSRSKKLNAWHEGNSIYVVTRAVGNFTEEVLGRVAIYNK